MPKCYITMCDEDGKPWPDIDRIEIPKEYFDRIMKYKDPSKYLNTILWIDRLEKDVSDDPDKEIRRLKKLIEKLDDLKEIIKP